MLLESCACCSTLFSASSEEDARYCDRCEVAYLEFKLGLLIAVYRDVARKADEV